MEINNVAGNVNGRNIEEEDSDDEEFELDENTYQRLMKNDPTITNLNIDLDEDECYFNSMIGKRMVIVLQIIIISRSYAYAGSIF